MQLQLKNGTLLLYENGAFRTEQTDLYIKDSLIAGIGNAPEGASGYETVDMTDRLIMPGLINMHTHVYMSAMRNLADDVDFDEWLFKRVMPVEERLSHEDAYWCNLLGMMEMISTGTTCYLDMQMFHEQSCKAANTAGMRAFIGRGLVGDDLYADDNPRFREAIEEMERYRSDTLSFVLTPHAPYTGSVKLFEQINEEARKRGLLKQTHLSESVNEVENILKEHGKTPVALLRDIGFLDENTSLAHCVQMRDNDIDILRETGATVVTNPASNMKLGNGFAPIEEMRQAGVNVALGTDGTSSNNTLNMFREMTLLSMTQKGVRKSSVAAPASFALETATVNAAKALHLDGKTGVIKEGAYADLAVLDLNAVSLFPPNDIVSSLVYSANGLETESVMIHGKWVYRNREFTGIDAEQVRAEVRRVVRERF